MELLEKLKALQDTKTDGLIDSVSRDQATFNGTFSYEALDTVLNHMRPKPASS